MLASKSRIMYSICYTHIMFICVIVLINMNTSRNVSMYLRTYVCTYVHVCMCICMHVCGMYLQGRIQDLWKGGGAAAVPFEDPLWNFKRGARAPAAPPLNPLVICVSMYLWMPSPVLYYVSMHLSTCIYVSVSMYLWMSSSVLYYVGMHLLPVSMYLYLCICVSLSVYPCIYGYPIRWCTLIS